MMTRLKNLFAVYVGQHRTPEGQLSTAEREQHRARALAATPDGGESGSRREDYALVQP